MRQSTFVIGLAFVVSCVVFVAWPKVDLWVSSLFFEKDRGFYANQISEIVFVHRFINDLGKIAALVLVGLVAVTYFPARLQRLPGHRRAMAFLLLTLVLGPGLLVNCGLKTYWGRARPNQVEQFGGTKQFTPALLPTDQCHRNGSFVSGHAALGFWLVTPAFISRRQNFWLLAGISAGGLIGLMRIAQGGHFLSDVIFAFFAVHFTACGLQQLLWHQLTGIETVRYTIDSGSIDRWR